MSRLGLFDSFDNLDLINPESVAAWLKNPPPSLQLENYLANRILYPQTIPVTALDMQLDLAILREALKINGPRANNETNALLGDNPFLNVMLRKILIPAKFLQSVPDLANLAWAFIDALLLNRKKADWFQDIWTIVLTDDSDEIVGSAILPQFNGKNGVLELNVSAERKFKLVQGGLAVVPCPKQRCRIEYKLRSGRILGKAEDAVEVYGGKLGLLVDGRNA